MGDHLDVHKAFRQDFEITWLRRTRLSISSCHDGSCASRNWRRLFLSMWCAHLAGHQLDACEGACAASQQEPFPDVVAVVCHSSLRLVTGNQVSQS